jgi:5-methylcytosine-specific restriction endonuclease McrA
MIRVGKLGIVRLTGKDLTKLRRQCYDRDGHNCVECGIWLRWDRGFKDSMHMAHIQNKRMYGDTLENVRSLCIDCHLVGDHNPKSVPKKVQP